MEISSTILPTVTRIPRMPGLPPIWPESMVIRKNCCTAARTPRTHKLFEGLKSGGEDCRGATLFSDGALRRSWSANWKRQGLVRLRKTQTQLVQLKWRDRWQRGRQEGENGLVAGLGDGNGIESFVLATLSRYERKL
jgi:hypothetical protein